MKENCCNLIFRTLPMWAGTTPPSSLKVDPTISESPWEDRACAVSYRHVLITEPLLELPITLYCLEPACISQWKGNHCPRHTRSFSGWRWCELLKDDGRKWTFTWGEPKEFGQERQPILEYLGIFHLMNRVTYQRMSLGVWQWGAHPPYLRHLWPAELVPVCGPRCQRCCPVATAVGWYFQFYSKDQAVCWLISSLLVRLQNRNLSLWVEKKLNRDVLVDCICQVVWLGPTHWIGWLRSGNIFSLL